MCKNLTVYENFYVEQEHQFQHVFLWRKRARELAANALNEVFPGNDVDVNAPLSALSIAQQQMVEIARAVCNPDLKMLVLDEPTSSLPAEQTKQLQEYIKMSSAKGVSYIYISHRLKEIMYLADRIYIMQNGAEKYQCLITETSEEDMVQKMGSGSENNNSVISIDNIEKNEAVSVQLTH